MSENYVPPKVLRMKASNKASGACDGVGSGDADSCWAPGNSAGNFCGYPGNSDSEVCIGPGNSA